ncbi:PTS sugar transporter subunit IIC [Vagococcus salmoninarum]|uniref:PTS sugar transporter subunit IIC n=1 Tax=Vagococcus salmoninarum TaxID=2739 RepID=UPI00187F0C98|nr:PTS transporter subunit EIIC [Vagococcus salmoninarum]MBE9388623.1 PTS sugar transporter subunit IIC [Vagococcus salmoninarum]
MNKLMDFLEEKVMPIANVIGSQRHMMAIRKGLIATMPLIIVGSFFTIFLNFPIPAIADWIEPFKPMLDTPFRYTVGIMSLYATYGIATNLASSYQLDTMSSGFLAVLAFLISSVKPVHITEEIPGVVAAGRYMNVANLSAAGLFGAMVSAIIAVEIFNFMKKRNITIKMPPGVPPEVSNSFIALLPTVVVILFFWFIRYVLNFDISAFLSNLLLPAKDILAGNSLFGGLLTVFLITFFWVLGIHGPAIMGPVIRPFWDISIAENAEAFLDGASANNMPNIFTEQFLQWYVWIGGAGMTLALVILMMFSKSESLRSLGRLSFLPGLFNINEPVIFGAPIVMNPILGIPFIIAPLVTTTLSYFLTVSNIVPMMVNRMPFTIPSPIAAWMSTDYSLRAGGLVIVNFLISLAIYYPFFKAFEKQQLAIENEAANLV